MCRMIAFLSLTHRAVSWCTSPRWTCADAGELSLCPAGYGFLSFGSTYVSWFPVRTGLLRAGKCLLSTSVQLTQLSCLFPQSLEPLLPGAVFEESHASGDQTSCVCVLQCIQGCSNIGHDLGLFQLCCSTGSNVSAGGLGWADCWLSYVIAKGSCASAE